MVTIKACGHGSYGQLGLNSTSYQRALVIIPDMTFKDTGSYLIKKKEEFVDLYTVDVTNETLVNSSTTSTLLNFDKGFKELSLLTDVTQYGKAIDKLNNFSLYRSGVFFDVSLFN